MFNKRIRVAGIAFGTLLVLIALCIVWGTVFDKVSHGTEKLSVLAGNPEVVDGVKISVRTLERVWTKEESLFDSKNMDSNAEYVYQTKTAAVEEGKVATGLRYEKTDVSKLTNRKYFTTLSVEFPQRKTEGIHRVSGSDISYDLMWYLTDGFPCYDVKEYRISGYVTFDAEDTFLYYYDGQGPEQYEGFSLSLNAGGSYTGNFLCELNGDLYGYLGAEPEYRYWCTYRYSENYGNQTENSANASGAMTMETWDFKETCENIGNREFADTLAEFGMPEIHMTVKKGIYRFDEDGTATCICPMGDAAKEFRFLWMTAEEEENTLTIIGTREDTLLAYVYALDTGKTETVVLWNGKENLAAWQKTAETCSLADLVTDGGRTYLCYTDMDLGKVTLAVFENGSRVFEGIVLQNVSGEEDLQDFSMDSNEEIWVESVVDGIEIYLSK